MRKRLQGDFHAPFEVLMPALVKLLRSTPLELLSRLRREWSRLLHLQLDVQVAELLWLSRAGRVGHQARALRGFRE